MRAFFKKPLVIATLVACLFGVLKLGQPIDHMYWNVRFMLAQKQTALPVMLVDVSKGYSGKKLDDATLATVLGRLESQAPKRIFFDQPIDFPQGSETAQKMRSLGSKITVVVRSTSTDAFTADSVRLPDRQIIGDAKVAYSGWLVNFLSFAQGAPLEIETNGTRIPALAKEIAEDESKGQSLFIPDFRIDPKAVPSITTEQLLDGKFAPGLLTGRSVILTGGRRADEMLAGYFGHGRVNPVYIDIAGAEAISFGPSLNLGELPILLVFVLGVLGLSKIRRPVTRRIGYGMLGTGLLAAPAVAQAFGAYVIPSTPLIGCMAFASLRLWIKWRRRVLQTSASGLPNFLALSELSLSGEQDIIVAAIGRYEEFLATLPAHLHAECANQVARRFAVGSGTEQIYHGEGGHFAWIERAWPTEQQTEHFEGMRALFSAPLLVGGHMFDTNVHFGLDRNYQLDTVTRLNTALSSANSALKAGRTIEQFEASRLADAPWELSLLARIDEGMKNGDIWLAYQPQWDYRNGCVSGAEALIRWNDPVRGPIRPDAFIVQAEKAGRIDALTYWVFEEAISAAKMMKDIIPDFQMSINLSAQLVDKPSLLSSISEIARRRGIDCRQFTIEVTETAAVYNRPAAVQNLQQLRAMGFRLAIDDFGTGESSLLYLAELPSDELKIDQHFVSRIQTGEREREIVKNTIMLAHALKQSVVAEGIEDRATFDMLRQMGCDTGQGYFIGRPESFDQFRMSCLNTVLRDVGS